MMRFLALLLLAPLLGGCNWQTLGGSVKGGECKVFEPPQYVVRGVARYDQDWIDSTIEGGVGGCHWSRPAARPPELDSAPAPKAATKPIKKRGLLTRVRDRVWPARSVAPIEALPAPPAAAEPAAEPPPIPPVPKPRSALDELLHPSDR